MSSQWTAVEKSYHVLCSGPGGSLDLFDMGGKCLQGKKSLKIRSLNSSRRRVRPRGPTTPFPSSGMTRYLVSRGPAGDTHLISHTRREVL